MRDFFFTTANSDLCIFYLILICKMSVNSQFHFFLAVLYIHSQENIDTLSASCLGIFLIESKISMVMFLSSKLSLAKEQPNIYPPHSMGHQFSAPYGNFLTSLQLLYKLLDHLVPKLMALILGFHYNNISLLVPMYTLVIYYHNGLIHKLFQNSVHKT